jgi:hypothetical protein
MDRTNRDGFGMAWAKGEKIYWYKTLTIDPESIANLIDRWSDYPRLVHFRLSTAGGIKTELCHPFEISPTARCRASLVTTDSVLIHNGVWHDWDTVYKEAQKGGFLPDPGPWSDTRLAACLAFFDKDWLKALEGYAGKVAIMNKFGEIHRSGDWKEYRTGMFVSNTHWNSDNHYNSKSWKSSSTGNTYTGTRYNHYNKPEGSYYEPGYGYWDSKTGKYVYPEDNKPTTALVSNVNAQDACAVERAKQDSAETETGAKAEQKRETKRDELRYPGGYSGGREWANEIRAGRESKGPTRKEKKEAKKMAKALEKSKAVVEKDLNNGVKFQNMQTGKYYKIINGDIIEIMGPDDPKSI